ncbi:MAG: cytidylate kinase family protein [bacterium]|nr:cytidylate kinase family protein [bacterium]
MTKIRNITVSGRIGSGTTTLAVGLSKALSWELLEGGALFEKIHEELKLSELHVNSRPDHFDLEYEERIKKMLREKNHQIVQSHLAGFDAQGIPEVFKILIVCEDSEDNDKVEVRIDRLVNRRGIPVEEAKKEVIVREQGHLEKWRRLYAEDDQNWVYWDKKYYDLVINTYSHNQEETLKLALEGMGYKD